jgi:hypothetical protein
LDERLAATEAHNATKRLREKLAQKPARALKDAALTREQLRAVRALISNYSWMFWLVSVTLAFGFLASAMFAAIRLPPHTNGSAPKISRKF